VEICRRHPGFEEDLIVSIEDHQTFALWHLGLIEWGKALRSWGIRVEGRRELAQALPRWNAGPHAHAQMRKGKRHEAPHSTTPLPTRSPPERFRS
jgi:hypothetical protein